MLPLREILEIPARSEEIPQARAWLAGRLQEVGAHESDVHDLLLVASEACTNVVRHAYRGRRDGQMTLTLHVDQEAIRLSIRDFGRKIDLSRYHEPNLDAPNVGGYGIYIMRELMDEVTFDTTADRGTELHLVKRRRADDAGAFDPNACELD